MNSARLAPAISAAFDCESSPLRVPEQSCCDSGICACQQLAFAGRIELADGELQVGLDDAC